MRPQLPEEDQNRHMSPSPKPYMVAALAGFIFATGSVMGAGTDPEKACPGTGWPTY